MDLGFTTSRVPEKHDFYVSLVERSVDAVVETAGDGALDALIMTGAPARGEATVIETPNGPFSMSDVDLVAVVPDGAATGPLADAVGEALVGLNAALSPFCPGADISFRTRSDLGSIEPSISAYELCKTPAVIWGDERVADLLPEMDAGSVPAEESLKLVHNRIVETLIARPLLSQENGSFTASASALYKVSKLALDSVTAALFLAGRPETTYANRVRTFREDVLSQTAHEKLRASLSEFTGEMDTWATFKATGDLGTMIPAPVNAGRTEDLAELARRQWSRYVSYGVTFWRFTLGSVVGEDLIGRGLRDVVERYGSLESTLRSIVRTRRTVGPPGLFAKRMPLTRSMFASPKLLAYITSMLAYARFAASDDEREWIDDSILHYCPFELPRGYEKASEKERTRILTERIALFHEAILLGRKVDEAS